MTEDGMAETTADTTVQTTECSEEETKLDPRALAKSVVLSVADEPEEVGDFAQSIDLGDDVTDFRFVCNRKGYEGWQWAVTLYHDVELDSWSVNESTLVPTNDSLLAPAWIPWKDRLEAADLSVTDSLGTDPDDPRMEDGFRKTEIVEEESHQVSKSAQDSSAVSDEKIVDTKIESNGFEKTDVSSAATEGGENVAGQGEMGKASVARADGETQTEGEAKADADIDPETGLSRELEDTVEEFGLSRRHVMSELGRSQTAKRWYDGQHGPKSLSTKTAEGNLCSSCAFFIGLKGDLDTMFGVCANRWSPDDGRVVSLDHGCGEHSEIEQPEPSHLWVQSKPAFDDLHIDIIAQAPREERGQVELIESIDDDDTVDTESEESDETDDETATENDIAEHAVPGSLDDDDESDGDNQSGIIGKGTVGSAVTADAAVESTIDLSGGNEEDSEDDTDAVSANSDSDSDQDEVSCNNDSDDADDAEPQDSEETGSVKADEVVDEINAGVDSESDANANNEKSAGSV